MAEEQFPLMVYSYPGEKQKQLPSGVGYTEVDGKPFFFFIVNNRDELSDAIKRGWFKSLSEAEKGEIAKPMQKPKRGRPKNKISDL